MRRNNRGRFACWLTAIILPGMGTTVAAASELLVGASTISITPDRPVNLAGQFHARIARSVESPCTATAVALESRDGERVLDQAIMVSCDLVAIRGDIQDQFREKVAPRLPGVDLKKMFLSATHTHTGPTMLEGVYEIPKDVMQPTEYVDFLLERLERSRGPGVGEPQAGRRELGARARRRGQQSTRGLRRRLGQDVRQDRPARLPRRRRARGPRRRGPLLLGPGPAARGHGGQRRLPRPGGREPLGRQRRLLARRPRSHWASSTARISACSAGPARRATNRRTCCGARRPKSGCARSAG